MLLRIACAVLSIVVTTRVVACSVTVTVSPQKRVRDAVIIAEGQATTDDKFKFVVGKVWKGAAPAVVALSGDWQHSTCTTVAPAKEGNDYLFFIDDADSEVRDGVTVYGGNAHVMPLDSVESQQVRRLFTGVVRVTRADLVALLRKWQYGIVSDGAFAEWLRKTAPVADTDDWDEEEASMTLHFLKTLDSKLNERPPEKNPCVALFRTHVVPYFIEALGPRNMTEERMEEIDAELQERFDEYEQCSS